MKPSDLAGYKEFVDLIDRSLFYIALDDEVLQKALSDLKDPKPTLTKYFEEACMAENRRLSFQNIAKSSVSTENKGVTISKWDVSQTKKWGNKSEKSSTQGVKHKDVTKTGENNANFGNKGQKQQNSDKQRKLNRTHKTQIKTRQINIGVTITNTISHTRLIIVIS